MTAYLDCAEVIRQTGPLQPVYLFCAVDLRTRAAEFVGGFPGQTAYAVKANPAPAVLQCLAGAGVSAYDVASPAEIALIRSLVPGAGLHYHNPVKPIEAIRTAFDQFGVDTYAADDGIEVDKIRAVVDNPADVEISVRFKLDNTGAAFELGSKFGIDPAGAAGLLRRVADLGFRPSLTFHPGSQCGSPDAWQRHIGTAAGIARAAGVNLYRLNVGGGFPASYEGEQVAGLDRFFEVIAEAAAAFGVSPPPLVCEPGRALVAGSVSLLTRVNHRRSGGELFINDGVYGGLQEQLYAGMTGQKNVLRLPLRVWRGDQPLAGEPRPTLVFGPTCDPVDRLPEPLMLPAGIEAGDYIEFGMLGAYGSATASRFNGFSSGDYVTVTRGFDCHGIGSRRAA